jgi:endonuclease/exonuclease/phosphatase family metal-dependent hydrolase
MVVTVNKEDAVNKIVSKLLGCALLGSAALGMAAEIDVMTQNQYLGADLTPVLSAATANPFNPEVFNAAVVMTLQKIAAARPVERAKALAAQIAQRNPDVVGLQEATRFACLPHPSVPEVPGKGCDDPDVREAFNDQLQNTEAALRGKYVVAGKVTNLKVDAIPFAVNGFPAILQVADRDAILVRSGLTASWVNFAPIALCRISHEGCNFTTRPPPFTTPLGPIAIERGFLAVDVTVKGHAYRIFNTHLEQRLLAPNLPETRLLQVGQASELLAAALGTWDGQRKLVVVGDMNSAPQDTIPGAPTPYQVFTRNGFTDAWTMRPQADDGLSCCQSESLTNRKSALYERIDMIFTLTQLPRVLDMKLLGDTMGDKTRPAGNDGLWASDHAAVAAKLRFD